MLAVGVIVVAVVSRVRDGLVVRLMGLARAGVWIWALGWDVGGNGRADSGLDCQFRHLCDLFVWFVWVIFFVQPDASSHSHAKGIGFGLGTIGK